METLFALVLTVAMTNGEYQDAVIGVYNTEAQCQQAAFEQGVNGNCYPVEAIVRAGEQPAGELAQQ